MSLRELQRDMWEAVRQPLTSNDGMASRLTDGRVTRELAEKIIKPNDRLSSFERLEIYNRQYWFRILDSFGEDFPGLRAIVGDERFDALAHAYLAENPSRTFSLRNLGQKLEAWLRANPKWIDPRRQLGLDMVLLEWAEIEAFDGPELPPMTMDDVRRLLPEATLHLQPYIRMLELQYPVDDLLIAIRKSGDFDETAVSNTQAARKGRERQRGFGDMKKESIFLVVHRVDYSVYFKRIDQSSFLVLQALGKGLSLADAIYVAFADLKVASAAQSQLVQQWFQDWATRGWFCRPTVLTLPRGNHEEMA
jgi:hypothetical protein